jgi:hypothetical protein
LEALQSLNIKSPIVETALGAFVSVNTFPLTKHLFAHIDSPFPRAASREIMNRFDYVGNYSAVSLNRGKATRNSSLGERLQSLSGDDATRLRIRQHVEHRHPY